MKCVKIHCEFWEKFSLITVDWCAMHVRQTPQRFHADMLPLDTTVGRSPEGAAATPHPRWVRYIIWIVFFFFFLSCYYTPPLPCPVTHNMLCFSYCKQCFPEGFLFTILCIVSCSHISVGLLIYCDRKVWVRIQTASLAYTKYSSNAAFSQQQHLKNMVFHEWRLCAVSSWHFLKQKLAIFIKITFSHIC